ncbi:MAG: hydroxyacid dehydrogenase [Ruminococcaceae bacterium]|nr:hydroxyacid dehydrogenase [Oscillospiraceae bacterium]
MKIALLQSNSTVKNIFSDRALNLLRTYGDVVINDSESTEPDQIKKVIEGADVAITSWGNTNLTKDILDCCPNLGLIMHAAGSIKPVVSDTVWERGIRVSGSPKPLGMGVAETALGFTISASKNFYNLNVNCHNGGWVEGKENIRELFDLRVGVLGSGWAGAHYLRLLQNFDVETVLYDPYCSEEKAASLKTRLVSFEELLRTSDIISIHAPSIPETDNMFRAETLAMMKKDAILINTARGSIVNEDDLYAHMKAGNLKYACLDVFKPEPPVADHPLRSLPNVIITPHLAGLTTNGLKRIGMHSAEEIGRYINGERMLCEVTQDMLATMA